MLFTRRSIQIFIISIFTSSLAGPVFAVNYQWLKDAPAKSFTDKDWKLFSDSLNAALNNLEDGGIQQWSNENSGNSGVIEVSNTEQYASGTCRSTLISNRAKNQQGVSRLRFCQQPDGSWKVDSTKP